MNSPNPALVTHRAAQRLPRPALLMFCAAYVLPGIFGRDPWKNADVTAFGYMLSIARGQSDWLAPSLAGLPADVALLPYWIGAAFIRLLGPWVEPAVAARVPFALLLVSVLVLTWYATYHLARTEAAQPLPFAFGGEASTVDYARAIADGAVLAIMASLGLLQLGHETTPELAQLAAVALFMYALSASPFRPARARVAVLLSLPALAASGAPAIAAVLAAIGLPLCVRSNYDPVRRLAPWVIAGGLLAALLATGLRAWEWRLTGIGSPQRAWSIARLLVWFTWPTWPLVLWTLWRWRKHWLRRHISVPVGCAAAGLLACLAMGGSDRALMLALPGLAVLAAFALPTLQRSAAAAVDWFSVFFFSICALAIWVIYLSMQTGVPAKPAANVARLAPGYVVSFSAAALVVAGLGTAAWLWLVRWRSGRNRHPLWKSLVLPAGGVALCWLLLMTLWLPLLDYARSYRPLMRLVAAHVPPDACIAAPQAAPALLAALEALGGYRVDAVRPPELANCEILLRQQLAGSVAERFEEWELIVRIPRPTDRADLTAVYRRATRSTEPHL